MSIVLRLFLYCFKYHSNIVLFQVETTNPEVTVWIVNLSKPKYLFPQQIKPTRTVEPGSYVTSASFFGENNIAVVWMNRKQNTSVIVTCRSLQGFNCTDVSVFTKKKNSLFKMLLIISDTNQFLLNDILLGCYNQFSLIGKKDFIVFWLHILYVQTFSYYYHFTTMFLLTIG